MIDLYEAFYTEIKNDPTLAGLLLYNGVYYIFDQTLPNDVLPLATDYAIAYGQVSIKKISYLDVEMPLFQFNCIAKTGKKARELKEELKRVLERFKGSLGNKMDVKFVNSLNEIDLPDKDTKLYISSIEYRVKLFGNNV